MPKKDGYTGSAPAAARPPRSSARRRSEAERLRLTMKARCSCRPRRRGLVRASWAFSVSAPAPVAPTIRGPSAQRLARVAQNTHRVLHRPNERRLQRTHEGEVEHPLGSAARALPRPLPSCTRYSCRVQSLRTGRPSLACGNWRRWSSIRGDVCLDSDLDAGLGGRPGNPISRSTR